MCWILGPGSSASTRSSTLPLSHRLRQADRSNSSRDREGYYSDRNELMRDLSEHNNSRYLCMEFHVRLVTDCSVAVDVDHVWANHPERNGSAILTAGARAAQLSVLATVLSQSDRATNAHHGIHYRLWDTTAAMTVATRAHVLTPSSTGLLV